MAEWPLFSIIIPVKNAAGQIRGCLESIKKLDYPPEKIEVILADGYSQDHTRSIGESFGAQVILNPKQVVASGRNAGFVHSKGDYIVFTDADCVLPSDYLKSSLKYFEDQGVAGVSGPAITPQESSPFEKGVKFVYELATVISGSVHREKIKKAETVKDIPGCNSIYRRKALEKAMPVDEHLLTAEDVDLNFRIRQSGYKLIAAPDVCVLHFRRASVRKFFRQLYRFAIGRLQAGKKDIRMINPAHVGVVFFLFILLLSFIAAFFYTVLFYLLWGCIGIGLCVCFLFVWVRSRSLAVAVNALLALAVALSAWSLGFLRELFFPLKEVKGR